MPSNKGFVFDDEPIESLLYGESATGPSPASLFVAAEAAVSEIEAAFRRNETDVALRSMQQLLARREEFSVHDLLRCTRMLGSLIPLVPCPIIEETAVSCGALLEPVVAVFLERDLAGPADLAGTLLFRWYEGTGQYADAARVVERLLEQAKRGDNRSHEAVLINNLAYEHYLGGDFARAEEHFRRAIEIFVACNDSFEVANARANLLLCRFGAAGRRAEEGTEQELRDLLPVVEHDWRRRKILTLLARIAEARGDVGAALGFARQALDASKGVPTRHRTEDLHYFEHLKVLRGDVRPA